MRRSEHSCSNNYGVVNIRGETYTTVAYYTQGSVFTLKYLNAAVMGWPNPPGSVRWIDLLGVSTKGENLAVIYLGLPPTKPNSVFMYAQAAQLTVPPSHAAVPLF